MFADSLPCNPRPFVFALRHYLSEGGQITDMKARRILWVNLQIQYGQCAKLDLASLDRDGTPAADAPALQFAQDYVDSMFDNPHDNAQLARIMRLAVMSYGNTGILDLGEEWSKLHEEWKQSKLGKQHIAGEKKPVIKLAEDKVVVEPFTVKPDVETAEREA